MRPPRWQLLLAYASTYFIWGGSYLALRFAVETVPPALAMGPRNLIGGIVLLGCAIAFRTAPLTRPQFIAAIAVGLIYFTLSHGLLATAQQHVPSGIAALIFALSVFGSLFGFVGMLVAVPVAAVIGVVARFGIGSYKSSLLYRGVAGRLEDRDPTE